MGKLTAGEVNDLEYWESYYKAGAAPSEPSLFARHIVKSYASAGNSLLELGCGNGRDAVYFASQGLDVTAVDQCVAEINELKASNTSPNLHFTEGDFTALPDYTNKFDIIYSRFTLHSITDKEQNRTLEWCYNNINTLGLLCVETRGQRNELYRKGVPVLGEEDAYIYEDHYRRFVKFEPFKELIATTGFSIREAQEGTGFAPFNGTDYHFIRIIAERK